MGTNYYLKKPPTCEHCGSGEEELHIGKSSAGWCFSLHVIPHESINELSDWEDLWNNPDNIIVDEYGRETTPYQMMDVITNRGREHTGAHSREFYKQNGALPGPNNLLRHRLGRNCNGHGEGTWDLITGDFS